MKGELYTITDILFKELVERNIKKIEYRSTEKQVNKFFSIKNEDLPNIKKELLNKLETHIDFPKSNPKPDVNFLRQSISGMQPIDRLSDIPLPI